MNYLQQAIKATQSFENKELNVQEWIKQLLGEDYVNIYSDEYCRRAEKIFSIFIDKLEQESIEELKGEDILKKIEEEKLALLKERKRLQTINTDYQATVRAEARNELFNEKIIDAIKTLEPIKIKNYKHQGKEESIGLLAVSDFHAGATYCIKGLNGEIVNAYDFDILQNRMWSLLAKLENDINLLCYDKLVIAFLGDEFENILRTTSLAKLKEPVIDTVIKFSHFLCEWIAEVSRRLCVPIEVITVGGNHDTQAILGQTPRFEDENLAKIVTAFMELRFENVEGIKIEPYTDVAYKEIMGTHILFNHGSNGNLQTTLEYFSNLYDVPVDEIYAGHYHRPESKSIGISELGDRTIYRVGSICGIDPFAKSIHKGARPSAYFAVYTEDGHDWSKNYYL